MRVAAVGAERPVVGPHRDAERRGYRLLAEREVARNDQILQEEIVGALFAAQLGCIRWLEPRLAPDVTPPPRQAASYPSI
jgi:hypothetical protein